MSNYYNMVRDKILNDQDFEPDRITWDWRNLTIKERLSVLFGADDPRVGFHWDDKHIVLYDDPAVCTCGEPDCLDPAQ